MQDKKIERLIAFLIKPSILKEKDLAAQVSFPFFWRNKCLAAAGLDMQMLPKKPHCQTPLSGIN